jgi:threonylcarbamoyladenosine tRNA methylthiotransferase MtaB
MPVEIVTFGCRLNIAESEAMRLLAAKAGVGDLAVVHSCAVTAEAGRQARQAARRLKRAYPDRPVVITGCGAQIEPERFAAMPEVSLVLGNGEKTDAAIWARLADGVAAGPARLQVGDILNAPASTPAIPPAFREHTRAFVQAQNGCDHRCTFCVIPFGRGRARSAPVETVVAEVRRHVEAGVREVVLTGVDLASYGREMGGGPGLGRLVRNILVQAPELPRLRLSSLDPVAVDDDLRAAFAEEPRLMPHLHLSLQHGDDLILKRMKRRHSRTDAIELCAGLRRWRPDMVFGADFIAGFPTEDEAMFARMLDLVSECGLTWLHVFPFSPRPGTPAARMPQLPAGLAQERAARLRAAGEEAAAAYLARQVGARLNILTERGDSGRSEGFAPVRFPRPTPPGELLATTIARVEAGRLIAA